MSALERIGSELGKTARSGAEAVLLAPARLFADTLLLGKSPVPNLRDSTRKAVGDLLMLPLNVAGIAAAETAKKTAATIGSITSATARAVFRNIPIPVPR